METLKSADVRRTWSEFIDSIVREKPKVIKRSRDRIVAISFDMLQEILSCEKLNVKILPEDDGSVSAVIDELDIMANAPSEELVIQKLAEDAIEYANDYYKDFSYWYSAPNRRKHLAHIFALLVCKPQNVAKELFVCQVGKN